MLVRVSSFAYLADDIGSSAASTRLASKPGATSWSRTKLRRRRAAPIVNTRVTAISETTRTPRTRCCQTPPPIPDRPPSLSASRKSTRANCRAGTRPARHPVSSARPKVKATTRGSIATVSALGSVGPTRRNRNGIENAASDKPAAPPSAAIRTLSARRCPTTRAGLAPSATRTATSRRRLSPRASSRPATLMQAISRTPATAASRIRRAVRTPWTSSVLRARHHHRDVRVGLGIRVFETRRDCGHLGVGGAERHAVAEPGDRQDSRMPSAIGRLCRNERANRHEQVRGLEQSERRRQDADDGRRAAVQEDRAGRQRWDYHRIATSTAHS